MEWSCPSQSGDERPRNKCLLLYAAEFGDSELYRTTVAVTDRSAQRLISFAKQEQPKTKILLVIAIISQDRTSFN